MSESPRPAPVLRLDMSDLGTIRQSAAAFRSGLRRGLIDTGFVRLVGHGVSQSLVDAAYRDFADFFALDDDSKSECGGVAGGQRGYTPFGVEHAKDSVDPDLKEFFHVGQPSPASADEFEPNHPTNAHPTNMWPSAPHGLRATSLTLFRELERCAGRILSALETAFELPPGTFSDMIRGGNSILRAVHYPPIPNTAPATAMRAAPHEDINLVTLLCGATDSGLEILSGGKWLPVETLPGEIVVDAGDMLMRVTNGCIPATTHRVAIPPGARDRHRNAMPFFAHPYPDCDLTVMTEFVPKGRSPAYLPVTAQQYLEQRLREIGLTARD